MVAVELAILRSPLKLRLPVKLADAPDTEPVAARVPLTVSFAFRLTVLPLWPRSELPTLALPPLLENMGMNPLVHAVVEEQTISLACS